MISENARSDKEKPSEEPNSPNRERASLRLWVNINLAYSLPSMVAFINLKSPIDGLLLED